MQYKTIVIRMLEERKQFYDRLRQERKLLSTMEQFAMELRQSHLAWTQMLFQMRPGSAPHQIASEAMEIALKELEDRLPNESHPSEQASLFLDAAMLFLKHHTSRG